MTYVVKLNRYPYLDARGNPTFDVDKAQTFEDKEMAELAAETCQGKVHSKIAIEKKIPKKRKKMACSDSVAKKNLANQSWLRGGNQ